MIAVKIGGSQTIDKPAGGIVRFFQTTLQISGVGKWRL
jgi:hypothetical protein